MDKDYKKLYEDALEKARELYDKLIKEGTLATSKGIESIFPELRESEDERIRNFLIKQTNSVLESMTDDDEEVPAWKSALAWLEKQEQKPCWKPTENQMSKLLAVIHDGNNANSESCHNVLLSLYNDLKSL